MITSRRLTALSALAFTAAASGCGPAGNTQTAAGSSPATSSASSAPAPPSDAAGLGAFLRAGSAGIRSAHLSTQVTLAGKTVIATGDEVLAAGKVQSFDLTQDIAELGQVRVVLADGKLFVRMPPAVAQRVGVEESKPWIEISSASGNPNVRQLAAALQSAQSSAAADQFTPVTAAATDVKLVGKEQIDGQPATHYTVTVDVAKLPETTAAKQQMVAAGLTSLPADLWVDSRGRPVKLTENFPLQGQPLSVVVTFGNVDAPVTIAPPPPAEVSVP